jgi:hypothetical protein
LPYRGGVGPSLSLDLTVDDLIALNIHVLLKTSAAEERMRRTQRRKALVTLPMVAIFIVTVAIVRSTFEIVVAVLVCAFCAVWILLLPTITARRIAKRVPRWIASGQLPAPTPSLLWIDEHGTIVNQSRDRTTTYAVTAIERVDETPDYVFIIVGVAQTLIIPRRIGEPAVQGFLQALHWYRGQIYADPAGHPPYGPNAWSA